MSSPRPTLRGFFLKTAMLLLSSPVWPTADAFADTVERVIYRSEQEARQALAKHREAFHRWSDTDFRQAQAAQASNMERVSVDDVRAFLSKEVKLADLLNTFGLPFFTPSPQIQPPISRASASNCQAQVTLHFLGSEAGLQPACGNPEILGFGDALGDGGAHVSALGLPI